MVSPREEEEISLMEGEEWENDNEEYEEEEVKAAELLSTPLNSQDLLPESELSTTNNYLVSQKKVKINIVRNATDGTMSEVGSEYSGAILKADKHA